MWESTLRVSMERAAEIEKLKKLLRESNNWVKAFYAYEKSEFVRRKVKQNITKIEEVLK